MKFRTKKIGVAFCMCIFVVMNTCKERKSSWRGTIEEADGVVVVKNPKVPLYPEMRIVFEEELSIGVEEGDENYMFGIEVLLNTDDEGNIYVTDWDKKMVKKYDREGRFLKSIGRPGQGPGEFQNISEVRFDAEGNIYLNDIATLRISFLSKDGNFLRAIKVPDIFERVIMNSSGFYIAQHSEILQDDQVSKWELVYGLFDNGFHLVKEFFRLPEESKRPSKRDEDSIAEFLAEGLSKMAFQPYVNYFLDHEENIVFGYPQNYVIKIYSREGKMVKMIQREFEFVEVSERHKEDFVKKRGEPFMSVMPQKTHHLKKKIFGLIKYPKYKPAYEQFTLMENGWVFVVVDSIQSQYAVVDIFNEDGQYLAQFEADIATDWLSFNNGKAYAVATEGDYKFIKRYNYKIQGYSNN